MKGFLAGLALLSSVAFGQNKIIDCKIKGQVVYPQITRQECKELQKEAKNTPTPTPEPTATPAPTNTPTPTPTPIPLNINNVIVHNCSEGSSCYGWTTGIEVNGSGFASDSQTKLKQLVIGEPEFFGSYQGGDGSTQIITDFYNLPLCSYFDVIVYGSTGTTTYRSTIQTLCI